MEGAASPLPRLYKDTAMVQFQAPTTFLLAGPSQSGKTEWIKRLIQFKDSMFTQPPKRVVYTYTTWQPAFDDMEGVEFYKGLPTKEDMESWSHLLLILDDCMESACVSSAMMNLFTIESHHRHIIVAILCQNIFPSGKCARSISLNCHNLILFATKRDRQQVQVLGRQMFPGQSKFFMDSYNDATSKQYGYLVCDLHPASDEMYQLRTHVFPGEVTWVYRPSIKEGNSTAMSVDSGETV
jgi:hypothetical protein